MLKGHFNSRCSAAVAPITEPKDPESRIMEMEPGSVVGTEDNGSDGDAEDVEPSLPMTLVFYWMSWQPQPPSSSSLPRGVEDRPLAYRPSGCSGSVRGFYSSLTRLSEVGLNLQVRILG